MHYQLMREYERTLLREALARNGGNQCRAAREIGLHRNTFATKLHALQVGPWEKRKPKQN